MADNVGRFNNEELSLNNLKTVWQDHIKEYFITSPFDGVEFKLDIVGEETLTAENDVTDHYVESNVAYQDQISRKPKVYTIAGEVGELTWYQKDTSSQVIGQVAQRLEGVVSFLPTKSKGFQQMKNTAMKAAQWVDTSSNVVSRLSDIRTSENLLEIGGTKQQQAYLRLLAYRDDRSRPLTIKTPWGVLKDYVITSLKFTQPKDTKDKSFISISLKEFRTTSVSTVKFDMNKYQGIAGLERQPKVDNGNTPGTDTSISLEDVIKDSETGETVKLYKTTLDMSEYSAGGEGIYVMEYVPETKELSVFDVKGNPIPSNEIYSHEIYGAAVMKINDAIESGVNIGVLK